MRSERGAAGYWRDRPVTVMGLGLFGGGAGVARWFAERGARVTVTDLRDAEELAPSLAQLEDLELRMVLGGHDERNFVETECVIANAAVPPNNRYLARAREHGVEVTTELGLFVELCALPQIWVSGTQGKSSTANALAQLLRASGRAVRLAGNIGRSLLAELAEGNRPGRVQRSSEDTFIVEVSSYQLECLPADIASRRAQSRVQTIVITNVLVDHLERHGTIEAYVDAKARLFEALTTGGNALLPAGDTRLSERAPADCRTVEHAPESAPELGLRAGRFALGDVDLGKVDQLQLPGEFQIANVLAALGAAHLAGVPAPALAATLPHLEGLPHRMEHLGTRDGRYIIDNGVSTTPDSTLAALDSVRTGCTLMLGGRTKRGLGFEQLAARAAQRSARVIAFGHGRDEIGTSFREAQVEVTCCATLEDAVQNALQRTPVGDTLLFSPAAASFDAYSNFRQRALAFRAALEH
ncbi:MAG: UDP-N-acetylmuramoylalanine--D-glutamate ligase [Planctomycetota bacterium]